MSLSLKHKDLHVVFRHADKIFLESGAFEPDHIVLYNLVDDLSIGPVGDLGSMDDQRKRKAWLEKMLGDSMFRREIISAVDEDVMLLSAIAGEIDKFEDIYIWTGKDAFEIIGTARLLNQLNGLDKRIHILDFSKVQVKTAHDKIVSPKILAVTESFQIRDVAKHFKLQESNDLNRWSTLWCDVQSVSSVLRIVDDEGEIVPKQETYFDTFLATNIHKEFQKAALVIGLTLVDIDFAVGDCYLSWRLRELALDKKMEFRGQLIEIRDYEVANNVHRGNHCQ